MFYIVHKNIIFKINTDLYNSLERKSIKILSPKRGKRILKFFYYRILFILNLVLHKIQFYRLHTSRSEINKFFDITKSNQ